MEMNDFKSLLVDQLNDAFCIEKASQSLLPKLQKAAQSNALQDELHAQLITVESNLKKVDSIRASVDVDVSSIDCESVNIIVNKAHLYVDEGLVNDIGILSQLERINQYKSAIYNSAIRFTRELDFIDAQKELQTLANHVYNMMDRLGRLDNDQSDHRAIKNL